MSEISDPGISSKIFKQALELLDPCAKIPPPVLAFAFRDARQHRISDTSIMRRAAAPDRCTDLACSWLACKISRLVGTPLVGEDELAREIDARMIIGAEAVARILRSKKSSDGGRLDSSSLSWYSVLSQDGSWISSSSIGFE